MKLTFTEAKIEMGDGVWLCLKANEPAPARGFVLNKKDRLYDCEIKEHREKRSLDANAYYWKLCGELAKALNMPDEDIYRRHIKEMSNYEVLCMQEDALAEFTRKWTSNHLGRSVETKESKIPGCVTVKAYYGSSDFSKSEMSRLIDNCIQDCKAVGVETMTPAQLAGLVDEWGCEHGA